MLGWHNQAMYTGSILRNCMNNSLGPIDSVLMQVSPNHSVAKMAVVTA